MDKDNNKDNIVELRHKIFKDGRIVDIKKNTNPIIEQSTSQNTSEDTPIGNNETYDAYLKYRQENANWNLKSKVKKLNLSQLEEEISVFSDEDKILAYQISLLIVNLVKPIFSMNPNLNPSNNDSCEILTEIKNYFNTILNPLKVEVVSRLKSNKNKKLNIKSTFSFIIEDNISLFNEILIHHFVFWLKYKFNNIDIEIIEDFDDKIDQLITNFFNKEQENIFNKIVI